MSVNQQVESVPSLCTRQDDSGQAAGAWRHRELVTEVPLEDGERARQAIADSPDSVVLTLFLQKSGQKCTVHCANSGRRPLHDGVLFIDQSMLPTFRTAYKQVS